MASGVTVSDDVRKLVDEMRIQRNDADQEQRVRIAVLQVVDEKEIQLEEVIREKDVLDQGGDAYEIVLSKLKEEDCRYILYDCHYETKESSQKEDLCFVTWCDETATIKKKMIYASSKDCLKKLVAGVKHHMNFTDKADCNDRVGFTSNMQARGVTKIEGRDLAGKK